MGGEKDDEIKKLKEKSHDVDHLKNENERLKNRPMPEEEDENFNKVTTQQKKSKSKPPENDRPPANDQQIEKLKVELKDKTKERSNLCWLLALLILLIALLCGKIFLLGDDSDKQGDDDRFNKLQIKYNTQVKQYGLLETDMKNAKYQHGRLLTEAKTAEEKSKQNTLTQTNYYKKEKAAHA